MELFNFLKDNYVAMFEIMFAIIAVGELVTRLTPTEKDDGFVKRVGDFIGKVADFLRIPNNRK